MRGPPAARILAKLMGNVKYTNEEVARLMYETSWKQSDYWIMRPPC